MTRDFNGTTDLINVGSGSTIDDIFAATNGGTVFAWHFPDTIGELSAGRIYQKTNTPPNGGSLFRILATSKMDFFSYRATTSGTWSQTNNDATLDAWNSTSVKYDSALTTNDPTFCHNGTIQTVGSGLTETATPNGASATDAAASMGIGNDVTAATTWDGYLSHVTFWKGEAITNNQMMAMGHGVNPFAIGSSTKPVLYLPIWGIESPEPDYSGNNNDGTLTGTTKINNNPPIEHMENYI